MINSFGAQFAQIFFIDPEDLCQLSRIFQPLLEQGTGDLGQFDFVRLLQLNTLKPMSKNLVVEIEVSLALHQDRTGTRIKIVDGLISPMLKAF